MVSYETLSEWPRGTEVFEFNDHELSDPVVHSPVFLENSVCRPTIYPYGFGGLGNCAVPSHIWVPWHFKLFLLDDGYIHIVIILSLVPSILGTWAACEGCTVTLILSIILAEILKLHGLRPIGVLQEELLVSSVLKTTWIVLGSFSALPG
jgi:hypothetical protein